jgi:hypothetical protein
MIPLVLIFSLGLSLKIRPIMPLDVYLSYPLWNFF